MVPLPPRSAAQQLIWRAQFSEIEAAIPVTWDDLNAANIQPPPYQGLDVDPAAFPSSWTVHTLLSKLKRDKVAGPNLLPPAVMKAGGEVMSRHLAILFAKAAAHAKEPLRWKGGQLIPLWKGKASPSRPDAYRSIFISNYTAKLFHQSFRQHLVRAWEPNITCMQYGGRASLGVDLAHHVLQCHQAWTAQKGIPSAVLFVDIRSAFYTILRQSFTALPSDNAAFLKAMTALGLTPEAIGRMIHATEGDAVAARLSTHMQHLLRDLMSQTYFTLPGLPDPSQTTRGTRPGDPVADILFNTCMTAILADFHADIHAHAKLPWLGHQSPIQEFTPPRDVPLEAYADVTFVDDIAVLLHARTNDRLIVMIQHVVEALTTATSKRGLELNLDRAKTEVLINVVGKGAKKLKETLHLACNCLNWTPADGPAISLPTCHEYKHLGTWLQTKHRHSREIIKRASAAKQKFGQLARSFFTKKISLEVRAKVFQSLIVSKLLYNVHTWAGASDKDFATWAHHAKPMAAVLLKGRIASTSRFQYTTEELFAASGILPLPDQLHAQRLRFLARLLKACPAITWMLLQATSGPSSWLALCRTSLAWLCRHHGGRIPLCADDPFEDWISYIQLNLKWKGAIKRASYHALAYHKAAAIQKLWQQHFVTRLASHGATLPSPPQTAQNVELWQCELCSKTFGSTRALAMHSARDHGYRKQARYFATGDTCQACLQLFHNRTRLSIHYEKNPRCYDRVKACWPPMPQTMVEALDIADKEADMALRREGWWASKAISPALKLAGPQLPPAPSPEADAMWHKMQSRRPSDMLAFENLHGRRITSKSSSSPQLWWQTSDLPAFVMQSPAGVDRGNGEYSMSGLAREIAMLHVRALVVVHFFSGFRRDGDIHAIIDQQVTKSGTQVFTLSVDLCMQRQHADLARPGALAWWKDRAAAGQLVCAGGGPPCETYTAARFHALQDGSGPRPLRSATDPNGLPDLTRKEQAQVWIGDCLLRFLIDILSILAAHGMAGFLEHPQFPTWCCDLRPASVWTMDSIRLLKGLNCVTIVSFDQCICGALGKKPTTLLLLRLPQVRSQLMKLGCHGRCHHLPKAHDALIGKQDNGLYQTAKAKIYPPGLNTILGTAMFEFAAGLQKPGLSHCLPDEFHPYTVQSFEDANVIQPDYHGLR